MFLREIATAYTSYTHRLGRPRSTPPDHIIPFKEDGDDDEDGPYDRCRGTVWVSMTAIGTALLAGMACLVWGLVVVITERHHAWPTSLTETQAEGIVFAVNLILTTTTDSLGYVHATSLRWALYREGRLQYNTNIRLFTSSRENAVNSWPANSIWISCLILSYACTSILLIRGPDKLTVTTPGLLSQERAPTCKPGDSCISLNGMAFLLLGVSLLGQTTIGAVCLWNHSRLIPTWSPNPLNNTVAALKSSNPTLRHRPDRCMLSSGGDTSGSPEPVLPARRQPNLFSLLPTVRWILGFLWLLTTVTFVWAVIVLRIVASVYASCNGSPFSWAGQEVLNLNDKQYLDSTCYLVHFAMDPASNSPSRTRHFSLAVQFILSILFLCGIQAATTVALHCIELVVNMTRDERCWRASTSASGARLSTTPVIGVLRSWEALILLGMKATLHWLLGQSMVPRYGEDSWYDGMSVIFDMSWSRLFILASGMAFTAIFATVLVMWRFHGSQPVCWGSLATLADLVDSWCPPSGRLWWGDKGVSLDGVRHAGTSAVKPLPSVRVDALYAGMSPGMRGIDIGSPG